MTIAGNPPFPTVFSRSQVAQSLLSVLVVDHKGKYGHKPPRFRTRLPRLALHLPMQVRVSQLALFGKIFGSATDASATTIS